MNYTLITKMGKCMSFYNKGLAEMYQRTHGGFIVDATLTEQDVINMQPVNSAKSMLKN